MTRPAHPPVGDNMIYFCLVRYKSGLAWAERDPANMSRRDTIADIMTGDLENIVTILECNPVEHVCSDVTEDVLAEIGNLQRSAARSDCCTSLSRHRSGCQSNCWE